MKSLQIKVHTNIITNDSLITIKQYIRAHQLLHVVALHEILSVANTFDCVTGHIILNKPTRISALYLASQHQVHRLQYIYGTYRYHVYMII